MAASTLVLANVCADWEAGAACRAGGRNSRMEDGPNIEHPTSNVQHPRSRPSEAHTSESSAFARVCPGGRPPQGGELQALKHQFP